MFYLFCHTLNPRFGFLDQATQLSFIIHMVHDHILYFEFVILSLIIWTSVSAILSRSSFILKDFYFGSILEIVWTVLPGLVLIILAIPSFRVLYLFDFIGICDFTVRIVGNQWYWSYDYEDQVFDAYMTQELNPGVFRLLDTDEYLVLPAFNFVSFLVTSSDVIHSWGVPGLCIKIDACPGRINEFDVEVNRIGTFYGSCYELCGVGHAFMPITVKFI